MKKNTGTGRPRIPSGKFLLQVFVDRELHRAFKIACLQADTTMADQIDTLIRGYLKGKGTKV
jgi:hypothetical protein